jgi:hypothetical protein
MQTKIDEVFKDAEKTIEQRNSRRQNVQLEFRAPAALEQIADELTYLRGEVKTVRFLLATMAAKMK